MRLALALVLSGIVCLCAPPLQAGDDFIGDITLGGGATWPQSSFAEHAKAGGVIQLRINSHVQTAEYLSMWADLSGFIFGSENRLVEVSSEDVSLPAKQRSSYWAASTHFGLQLGSPTRRGAIRPRAAIGPGWYLFNKDVSITLVGDSEPWINSSKLLGRFGWRAIIGVDLFFVPKGGIALDFIYDHVWRLPQSNGDEIRKRTSRFTGFAVNVVFASELVDP